MQKREKGFSLIEVMIVVVIVGILAAIAYPSYQDQMIRTRRSDAHIGLMNMATHMERYFTENNSYSGAISPLVVGVSTITPEGFYTLSISSVSTTAFTLSAAPQGAQTDDTICGTLTLTNTNIKGPNPSSCW